MQSIPVVRFVTTRRRVAAFAKNGGPRLPAFLATAATIGLAMRPVKRYSLCVVGLMILAVSLSGCTSLQEYVQNGFKVGPNYGRPPAPVAQNWIDVGDPRVRTEADEHSHWRKVFNDPVLDSLVCSAYLQNLTLRQAGMRELEPRPQVAISVGNIVP